MRVCCKCKIEKPLEEFHRNKNMALGYGWACKDCNYLYRVEKRERQGLPPFKRRTKRPFPKRKIGFTRGTKEYNESSNLWKCYRITVEERDKAYAEQDYKCGICFKELKLVVDHCHTTGKFRGGLCTNCNTAFGSFCEDVEIMSNAILYAKKHNDR